MWNRFNKVYLSFRRLKGRPDVRQLGVTVQRPNAETAEASTCSGPLTTPGAAALEACQERHTVSKALRKSEPETPSPAGGRAGPSERFIEGHKLPMSPAGKG
ncbi:unnamed protein product [Arctogadus glacialis]